MNSRLVQIITGSLIVVFGVVVLVDLLARFVDMELLLRWWPIVFILIGILQVSSRYSHTVWVGTALLLVGTVAVLDRVGIVGTELRPIIIGIVLLLAGLLVVTPLVTAPKKQ